MHPIHARTSAAFLADAAARCAAAATQPVEPGAADAALAALSAALDAAAVPQLVAEFRAIMSDPCGGIPNAAQCRAVIEYKAAALPAGPQLWALWHVPHGSDVATLCEFDGSICYEAYRDAPRANAAAASLNGDGYSQSGRYIVARIPAGVAGNPCDNPEGESQAYRASGPAVAWHAGMDCGFTVCRASAAELLAADAPAMVPQQAQQQQAQHGRAVSDAALSIYVALVGHRDGSTVTDASGVWASTYLDNARPAGMSARSFAGHLSALQRAGLYRTQGDDCFGLVLLPSDPDPAPAVEAPAMVPVPAQQQQACAATVAPIAPVYTRRSPAGRKLRRIVRTIAARACVAVDPIQARAELGAYIAANAVAGRIVVRHGGTDCDGASGESASVLPATVTHFAAFREACSFDAEGPWFCYITAAPDREAFESAYDARLCGLSVAEFEHFAGR